MVVIHNALWQQHTVDVTVELLHGSTINIIQQGIHLHQRSILRYSQSIQIIQLNLSSLHLFSLDVHQKVMNYNPDPVYRTRLRSRESFFWHLSFSQQVARVRTLKVLFTASQTV
ncbi:hypothetical protein EYF80_002612 [Liparis tanakae]|uniref:Uncharacterized protein n=1 Tax=Liparis tanakae TaxID=230148 RepID=A0A4Z2JBN7_9TELE|nr:hypothetical protein EYF80_002612 [Liparis tanakae]